MYTLQDVIDDIEHFIPGAKMEVSNPFERLDTGYRIKYSDLYREKPQTEDQIEVLVDHYVNKFRIYPVEEDPDQVFRDNPDVVAIFYATDDPCYKHRSSTSKMKLIHMVTQAENEGSENGKLGARIGEKSVAAKFVQIINRDRTSEIIVLAISAPGIQGATHGGPVVLQ